MEKELTTKYMINALLKHLEMEEIALKLKYKTASIYAWANGLREPKYLVRCAIEEMYNEYCK